MKDFLLPEEIKILTEKHHDSAYRKQADRIKTILYLNRGFNLEKQEEFKKTYQELKIGKYGKGKIYFVDASHPQHNNMPFYGWIYKGEEKAIKTNSGRERINLNGALNLEDMDITVLSEKKINTHSMMRLILQIVEKQPTGEIFLIMDNASYNHS